MTARNCAVPILHWTVGLVVLVESCLLAFGANRVHSFARSGLPHRVRPALAWPEIAGAILFLIPATSVVGTRLLLCIFFVAVLLHLVHGQRDIGALLVYAAAVWAVDSDRNRTARATQQ